jgi:hypothetical protein
MKTYKVIALSVMGRRKIYHSGETVKESSFDTGHAEQLVEKGFLKPIFEDVDVKETGPGGTTETETWGEGTETADVPTGEKTVEDYTKNEIMDNLKILNIDFKPQASKQELFDLWNASIKK